MTSYQSLEKSQRALAWSRQSLAETEAALEAAHEEETRATLRATHDSMTSLPNRGLFDDRLAHAISLAERHGWTLAVMFLDLDQFKSINDTHGHAVGDQVLREVARRLTERARDEDTVCRNGGDEFLYLLIDPRGAGNLQRLAECVVERIAEPLDIAGDMGRNVGGQQLVVRSSIGIAIYPEDGTSGDQLVRHADIAMYEAKKGGSGCVFFSSVVQWH